MNTFSPERKTHLHTSRLYSQTGVDCVSSSFVPAPAAGHRNDAMSLIQRGEYEAAIRVFGKTSGDDVVSNALGVCLLRVGRAAEALPIFRGLILNPGSTFLKENVNPVFVRNFAVALLMCGLPGSVKNFLGELPERNHPVALEITNAIRNWEKTLPLFRRLDWKLSGIAPSKCQIKIEFEPGEFFYLSQQRSAIQTVPVAASSALAV